MVTLFTEVMKSLIGRMRYQEVNFPEKNLELRDYISLPATKENEKLRSKWDLIANIFHDGDPREKIYRVFSYQKTEEGNSCKIFILQTNFLGYLPYQRLTCKYMNSNTRDSEEFCSFEFTFFLVIKVDDTDCFLIHVLELIQLQRDIKMYE
ncbi:uncharacterized protein LOC113341849 [Papaver somniferum]|uniref:uncharacterized protein LOC113341849 n=1 Tax=Papaver somniferum TaxID=3469 RepID=UPI000E6FAA7F|nr:uncharacterized protein LOC113341849 [Papaver somniferum]